MALDRTVPAAPEAATAVFGDRRGLAERYVRELATTGIDHGLIGPREAARLWERHVLNCAVVQSAFPSGARVADIGSGAGLPGLCLAIARSDLELHLIEPLERRCTWLGGTVTELGLTNVSIIHARAEQVWGTDRFGFVTARAVSRIDTLAGWSLPLLEPRGALIALKGSSATEELAEHTKDLARLGAVSWEVEEYGGDLLEPPTRVIRVTIGEALPGSLAGTKGSKRTAARGRATAAASEQGRRHRGRHRRR